MKDLYLLRVTSKIISKQSQKYIPNLDDYGIDLVFLMILYFFQGYQCHFIGMLLKVMCTFSQPQLLQSSLNLRLKTAGKPAALGRQ